jgi:hypothetical protein
MPDLPSGTVTFLFTDVEGSTKLLEELGTSAYREGWPSTGGSCARPVPAADVLLEDLAAPADHELREEVRSATSSHEPAYAEDAHCPSTKPCRSPSPP